MKYDSAYNEVMNKRKKIKDVLPVVSDKKEDFIRKAGNLRDNAMAIALSKSKKKNKKGGY